MQAGKPEAGCPALDESYRLDPKPGALFTAAECQAVWGRPYAAHQRYAAYVTAVSKLPAMAQARHAERVVLARAALESLEPRIPRLQFVLPTAHPRLDVTLDGTALSMEALKEPVLVDPGLHTIQASAGGQPARTLHFSVEPGEDPARRRAALRRGSFSNIGRARFGEQASARTVR